MGSIKRVMVRWSRQEPRPWRSRRRRTPDCSSARRRTAPTRDRRRACSSAGSIPLSTFPPPAGTRSRRPAGPLRAAPRSSRATSRGRSAARRTASRCRCPPDQRDHRRHVRRPRAPDHALLRQADERHAAQSVDGRGAVRGPRRPPEVASHRRGAGGGQWQPTLPSLVVANLLPLLPGARTPVRFRFTPVGRANWQIDDVYVDPWARRWLQAAGTCWVMQCTPPPPRASVSPPHGDRLAPG